MSWHKIIEHDDGRVEVMFPTLGKSVMFGEAYPERTEGFLRQYGLKQFAVDGIGAKALDADDAYAIVCRKHEALRSGALTIRTKKPPAEVECFARIWGIADLGDAAEKWGKKSKGDRLTLKNDKRWKPTLARIDAERAVEKANRLAAELDPNTPEPNV